MYIEDKSIAIPMGIISGYAAIVLFGVVLVGRVYCKRWKLLNWSLKNGGSEPENKVLTWPEYDLHTFFEGLSRKDQQEWLSRFLAVDYRKLTAKQRKNLELIKEILDN